MTQNNNTQTLLEYAGKLEWQEVKYEVLPDYSVYVDETKPPFNGEVFLLKAGEDIFSGYWVNAIKYETQNGTEYDGWSFYDTADTSKFYLFDEVSHYMPLLVGNAGAVIRELVEAVSFYADLDNWKWTTKPTDTDFILDCGSEVQRDFSRKAQQALAKAAALVGGRDA